MQSEALVLRIDSGDETVKAKSWDSSLLVVASWDLFEAVRRGMALAASLSGDAKPLHMKEQPASLDYFGWCTWDAFYSGVCAQVRSNGSFVAAMEPLWLPFSRSVCLPTMHEFTYAHMSEFTYAQMCEQQHTMMYKLRNCAYERGQVCAHVCVAVYQHGLVQDRDFTRRLGFLLSLGFLS